MFSNRFQGLNSLHGLIVVILMSVWFTAATVLAVNVWGVMEYYQVNYPIYLFGIALAFLIAGSYRRPRSLAGPSRIHWLGAIGQANSDMLAHTLILFGLIYATKDKAISRQFVGAYLVSSWMVLVCIHRYIPPRIAQIVFDENSEISTIMVGSMRRAKLLRQWVGEQRQIGLNVKGVVVYEKEDLPEEKELPVLGEISELEQVIRDQNARQVILLETRQSKTFVQFVVEICEREGLRIIILNPWQEYFHKPMQAINEGEHTFFTFQDEPLQNPLNRVVKRVIDILVSLPVCLFVLPPLALLVKVMQVRQSPGPLMYQQTRTGLEMRKFDIYKFRTMHVQTAADEGRQATNHDDRIYPFGRFLRRTSLDEFPQFLNVLIGSMSVVGPRPHLVRHDEEFARLVEIYKSRHHVKPGITGMAQYKGYRGEVHRTEDLKHRLEHDLQYIYNWSIWLDLGIILKTFSAVFFPPKSAY